MLRLRNAAKKASDVPSDGKRNDLRAGGGGSASIADAALRLEKIDADLQALIGERLAVSREILGNPATSGGARGLFCESLDEALRACVERYKADAPITTLEPVWRALAAAAAGDIEIHCETAEDPAALLEAVRYHFGFSIPVEAAGDAPDVIRAVAENDRALGLIRLDERADLPWWRSLGAPAPEIVARLPFLVAEERPADMPLIVVAQSTGAEERDVAAYDARWRGALPGRLMAGGLEVLAFHRTSEGVDALIAARGDHSAGDVARLCAEAGAEPDTLRRVGAYAAPIDIDEAADETWDEKES
ncbi:chorismate mutase [Stappia sp. GBMRC 2046]|uniref:Chorismate mutase n=1 Tax=Stappia sediminis TaxID=2692190 RepID=A0A7X3LU24_9HYPH|nr:chorismate mutase [Stappia sediminis]MXN65096.1 chorismate mutase [Stappia sediminis]